MMNISNHPIVNMAYAFAFAAHAAVGQKRKYSGEDYIVHPVEVFRKVASLPDTTVEMMCAALLHDVVEDTAVTFDMIEQFFGPKVADLVGWLTDVSKPGDGNRAERRAFDRAHTHQAPYEAQTIKLADLCANTRDITSADPKFAVVYMEEKRLLLEGMIGDPTLMEEAWKLQKEYLESVKNG